MKITRKMTFKTSDICAGDQITVNLKIFGKFTATCQKVTDKDILFLFDEIIDKHQMNKTNSNDGSFDASDMKQWLNETLLWAFPQKLRNKITEITLPTYGQIFGHDEFYEKFEPDEDEQFELMKQRGNRVCDFDNDWSWWWLRNATKKEVSASHFANVDSYGLPYYSYASNSLGVRPEFRLVR